MNKSRLLSAMLSVVLLLSGCSTSSSGSGITGKTADSAKAANSVKTSESAKSEEPAKLTYWAPMGTKQVAVGITDYSKLVCYDQLQKAVNVNLQFIHPAAGQEQESFNLMLASHDYPDLIEYNFATGYPGGLSKAYQDGLIIRLNDLIDKYAPNFKAFMKKYPNIAKQFTADNGDIYAFPDISVDSKYIGGFMVRKDWLDELGLKEPETIDEWETVLRAFKEKKGATAPFTIESKTFFDSSFANFEGAYGLISNYMIKNGKVTFGPIEPEYRKYLEKMSAWYKEGLFDMDFVTNDRKAVDAKMLNGQSGAMYGQQLSNMSRYLAAKKGTDYDLTAVQYPVLNKGDEPSFLRKVWEYRFESSLVVSSNCKNIEAAIRAADWPYSPEGRIIMTFGKEGMTYEVKDGKIAFTELLTKDPDKLLPTDAIAKYARGGSPLPGFTGIDEFTTLSMQFPQQVKAVEIWSKYDKNVSKSILPRISLTPEEASDFGKVDADVMTYCREMITKFIIGTEPVSNYDSFVENIKKMGIEKNIAIDQAALDRFNKR